MVNDIFVTSLHSYYTYYGDEVKASRRPYCFETEIRGIKSITKNRQRLFRMDTQKICIYH